VAISCDEVVQGMGQVKFMSRRQTGIGVVGQGDSTEGGTRPPLEVVNVYGNMGSREQYKTSVQKIVHGPHPRRT